MGVQMIYNKMQVVLLKIELLNTYLENLILKKYLKVFI